MKSLRKLFNKINIDGEILYNEPLSLHSTFKIGGNAAVYLKAASINDIKTVKKTADSENISLYPLGEGANVLFSDSGYDGIILDTSLMDSLTIYENNEKSPEGFNSTGTADSSDNKNNLFSSDEIRVSASAGVKISFLAQTCTEKNIAGLENFYGMPGYAGGSVYMNARCYGVSISERIKSVIYIDENCMEKEYIYYSSDFDYKKSPFQNKNVIITQVLFSLKKTSSPELLKQMYRFKDERKEKGHYLYPCAGSVFKNNRDFGEPTGRIIDRLGLRGLSIGDAKISDKHANIIINTGNASEKDIKKLIDYVRDKVYKEFGFNLEREVIYVDEGGK